jgi:hypothetical protein
MLILKHSYFVFEEDTDFTYNIISSFIFKDKLVCCFPILRGFSNICTLSIKTLNTCLQSCAVWHNSKSVKLRRTGNLCHEMGKILHRTSVHKPSNKNTLKQTYRPLWKLSGCQVMDFFQWLKLGWISYSSWFWDVNFNKGWREGELKGPLINASHKYILKQNCKLNIWLRKRKSGLLQITHCD